MAPLALSLLLLPLAVSGFSIPSWTQKSGKAYALQKAKCSAIQDPSPDVVVDNYMPISRANNMTSRSSVFFDNVRRVNNPKLYERNGRILPRQAGVGELSAVLGGAEYLIDITFGGQDVKAVLDTGSSDTWLIQQGYVCTDSSNVPRDESYCQFGPVYNGGFTEQIPDQNFQIGYGDGEFVTGNMGYQDVTIGGVTVPHQEV
jgi:hypothetical protein